MLVICATCFLLLSCKDEFNIPESDSYIDGDAPEVTEVISPIQNEVYTNTTSLPIIFTVKDNYFLGSIEVEVRDMSSNQSIFDDNISTKDSTFEYSLAVLLPENMPNNYELYITVKDEVENVNYKIVSFSTQ